MDNLIVSKACSQIYKSQIITIIKQYWDCYCKAGVHRTILGYEFAIDTGSAKPVCCRKPNYGPHESTIILEQIQALLRKDWIEKCRGPWGSLIVLAAKPHQETITDIDDFIWRMCVSYRRLNSITKPFEYPIPRCDRTITSLGIAAAILFFIALDARQGYHQVAVKKSHREKLAFFAPDDEKYCFKVMPFGPTNAPAFYTAMMFNFRQEWEKLFLITLRATAHIENNTVTVTDSNVIHIGQVKLVWGSRTIIDDILLWCNIRAAVIILMECVCKVFLKYRVSFRLDKCEFLKDRVEYVGHDLMASGNTPAKSKFSLISDWKLPEYGQSLHSFVGLVCFYSKYCPYFEIKLKPFRKMIKQYYRKVIPLMAWTPQLIALFEEAKSAITSSPVCARYDPSKPTFLKTDWSAEGMAWILMQPDDSPESIRAMKTMRTTGECLFDLHPEGPRLKPISFGSRACLESERYFHSFVGETACGRWAISQNRQYLWGQHFYWMCDCSAVKEILEYQGTIPMICRWAQELLGYNFTIIHRKARMMADVDALTRRFGPLIAEYCQIALILSSADQDRRPKAYDSAELFKSKRYKVPQGDGDGTASVDPIIRVFNKDYIAEQFKAAYEDDRNSALTVAQKPHTLTSVPVLVIDAASLPTTPVQSANVSDSGAPLRALDAVQRAIVYWLCFDDISGSFSHWHHQQNSSHIIWKSKNVFSSHKAATIFKLRHPLETIYVTPTSELQSQFSTTDIHGFDMSYLPSSGYNIYEWLSTFCAIVSTAANKSSIFVRANGWINTSYFPHDVRTVCLNMCKSSLPSCWSIGIHNYNAASFGDRIAAQRTCIQLSRTLPADCDSSVCVTPSQTMPAAYNDCLHQELNKIERSCDLMLPSTCLQFSNAEAPANFNIPQALGYLTDAAIKSKATISSHASNCILDPGYPGLEPTASTHSNECFGRRFGIPFKDPRSTVTFSRAVSSTELLNMYSITLPAEHLVIDKQLDSILDDLLPFCIPSQLRRYLQEGPNQQNYDLRDAFLWTDDDSSDAMACYFTQQDTTNDFHRTLDWSQYYNTDPDTATIMAHLAIQPDTSSWSNEILSKISPSYHVHLRDKRIQLLYGKLVLLKPVIMNSKYISLIIIPHDLRRKIFSHYHAGPSGGHMGEYKTLYRMRLCFFWPKLRSDVKEWVKKCPHCVMHKVWRNHQSELYFSWPITSPFWIMHVDLWSPGHATVNSCGQPGYLLNSMCDLTQSIVSSPTFIITA